MPTKLCCPLATPYKPIKTDYEHYFQNFLFDKHSVVEEHVIQFAKQINFGKLLGVQFYKWNGTEYELLEENQIMKHEYTKINSFKNFVCPHCNLFFEVNLYMKKGAPRASHHWRYNINRLNEIDSIN